MSRTKMPYAVLALALALTACAPDGASSMPSASFDGDAGLEEETPDEPSLSLAATRVHFVEVLGAATFAKPDTRSTTVLRQSGACVASLTAGRRIALQAPPVVDGSHLRISPVAPIAGTSGPLGTTPCSLAQAYVYVPHVRTGSIVQPEVLILMYHEIVATSAEATSGDDVVRARFREQLDWLRARYTTIDATQLYVARTEARPLPLRPVLLTFDDGYRGVYTLARPELVARSMRAALFVHTDFVGTTSGAHPKMTWAQLREIDASPLFEVHSHTRTHARLPTLDDTRLQEELAGSRRALEAQLGGARRFLAYPFGDYDARVLASAARHYDMTFAVGRPRLGNIVPGMHDIPRLGVGRSITSIAAFESQVRAFLTQP